MYEVICGNIGSVYSGDDRGEADRLFDLYADLSIMADPGHRAYGEDVTLFEDGEIVREHVGSISQDSMGDES